MPDKSTQYLLASINQYKSFDLKRFDRDTKEFVTVKHSIKFLDCINLANDTTGKKFTILHKWSIFYIYYNNIITDWQIWGYDSNYEEILQSYII